MEKIYQDMAARTGGDIYVGVVGPVRTGKSTFIKRFMETLVIPNIVDSYARERARDELPQSASGRTVMTAEPKFVPEDAVRVKLAGGTEFAARLVDCVGYMVEGAIGFEDEEGNERMISTPWSDEPIPMTQAAEIGTHKVISEHSTIGIVMTTDGSITNIPRPAYVEAEERVIRELKELSKPFIVLLNSAHPFAPETQALQTEIAEKYDVSCIPVNCLELDADDVSRIIGSVLYEFPITEVGIYLPPWVDALPIDHPVKASLFDSIKDNCKGINRIRDVEPAINQVGVEDCVSYAGIREIAPGIGSVTAEIECPRELFYRTLSERSGLDVSDDGDLMSILTEMASVKHDYDRIKDALTDVKETGYGIVYPSRDELTLEEPEIVRHGGKYGVRLKASAPSIHMILANIETEVSPLVGGERQSEEIISYLLQEFEGDTGKIWSSNIFGKPLYDIAGEGLQSKIKKMPEDAQGKLRETLQRIVNEGQGGLICILL
ncbi:MAG: stage IV sporulation protein A [Oscillospiraceae bacterium]|jgi:stage IV sporulation protein A|nr:stage IV sporulation protein A [Oscillospiraceae bacterium]